MTGRVDKRGASQHGLVLIVTLLFLLVIGILATLAAETAVLQLRMAGNEQARVAVLQQALSVIDAALRDPATAVVRGGEGYRICGPHSRTGCDEVALELPPGLADNGRVVEIYLSRKGAVASGMPHRSENEVSSAAAFDLVRQELTVSCASQDERQGQVRLVQGLMFGVPAAEQTGVFATGVAR